MENQVDTKSIVLKYGLILGFILILSNVAMYATGNHFEPHWSVAVTTNIAFIILVVLGIKEFKTANNSYLKWIEGVKIGVGIAIVAALLGSIYNYIFMTFIEPDFMAQMMEIQNEKLLDQGMSEDQIEAANKMAEAFQGPLISASFGIIASAIGGFIVAAIAGAIMKKTQEEDY